MPTASAVSDELRESFESVDKNGDGWISCGEFADLLRNLDHGRKDSSVRASFDLIDTDRDGRVSFGEFRQWASR
jgi:Ca2+-binding EF-hand superfamily protein